MRVYGFFLVCAGALVIAFGVWAVTAQSRAADEATRIVIDQQNNVIRFVIEGEERAVLDADGLHVRGDINYGGTITDYGEEGFARETVKQPGSDQDAP